MSPRSGLIIFAAWLLLWIFPEAGHGQDWTQGDHTQAIADQLMAIQDEDLDYEALFENTMQSLTSPLDLNTASEEELRSLQILSDSQVDGILRWRAEHGPLLDIHELQVIPGFARETILRLLPFVRVIDPSSRIDQTLIRRMYTEGNMYLVTRYERTLEKKRGFGNASQEKKFKGSADQLYIRMRSSLPGDYSIGMTGEKDEGEPFRFNGRQTGFDFTSMHFQLKNKAKLRNLVIGDFQSQFAQGLLLGGAFTPGKGGEQISTARKAAMGFQPYTSVQESAYKRGGAVTLGVSQAFDVSLFYSNARRDASGTEGDTSEVNTIQKTGLHRTQRELQARKKLVEQDAGVILHLKKANIDVGLIANGLRFDRELRKKETVYNPFAFNDDANINVGFFLNYRLGNISFFSEAAKSLGRGAGAVTGLLVSAHEKIEICVLYRHYAPDFVSLYGNAFSEGTETRNERGLYWAWKYRWNRRYSVNGYVDLFYFPWLGFRRYKPSAGYEWLLRGTYRPSRDVHVYLQFRQESKAQNVAATSPVYKVATRVRRNAIVNFDYGLSKTVRLKSRIQYNSQFLNEHTMEGWAFIQDITFRLGKLGLTGRHGIFDTDHYDNRHYVYERDAWSAYSMPAYSGVGVRNYALAEYKLSKTITLWIRYTRTRMLLDGEIGSGDERIEGNTRNDVKFQARIAF